MTDEQLREIRERCEKATPGEWESPWDHDAHRQSIESDNGRVIAHAIGGDDYPLLMIGVSDADFICHARLDIPALLDEVERLQSKLKSQKNKTYMCIKAGNHLSELLVETQKACAALENIAPTTNLLKYRPCLANGKKALFHCWVDIAEIRDAVFIGSVSGQVRETLAIVEYENGQIVRCRPYEIQFFDSKSKFDGVCFDMNDKEL